MADRPGGSRIGVRDLLLMGLLLTPVLAALDLVQPDSLIRTVVSGATETRGEQLLDRVLSGLRQQR